MKFIVLLFLILPAGKVMALNLEDYLKLVQSKHQGLRAFNLQQEAALYRKEQGDLELSPILFLKGSYLDDKKTSATTNTYLVTHSQYREYSMGLAKKFSFGTQAQISAAVTEGTFNTLTLPSTESTMQQSFGSLGIALSQSLWKNAFGSGTRLRQERENYSYKAEKNAYDLQGRQLLIDAESAFWEQIYLQEEIAQRRESLLRAKRIENWVNKRLNNGIGDKSDLLNAQGLVAARELQLLNTQDELIASQKKIADLLELKKGEKLPEFKEDLAKIRNLNSMISSESKAANRILRLDSYLSVLEAKAKSIASEEVMDSLSPDLILEGSYKTNSLEESMAMAANKMTENNKPTAAVAVKLTWMIDDGSKSAAKNLARSEALAAALKKERKLIESDTSWEELKRRHGELSKKIEAAASMSQIQSQKASVERDKLAKGRSVTMQVINAEQDAAEAELTLTKLKAEQRKLEAQSRMYILAPESI